MAVVGQLGLLECGRNCWQQKAIDKICISYLYLAIHIMNCQLVLGLGL